jgi:dTMP kinase
MKYAVRSGPSNTVMLANPQDNGLLIAFEGPDGSGKTTQRKLLKSWLQNIHEDVVVTKWSSSPSYKPIIKAKKAARLLDAPSYALLHAADFWHRYETVIQPALRDGKVVLADRYVFTGIARDSARGMDPQWCHTLYGGARKPDLVFYFKAPLETCAMRIASARDLKFYEAGQDVTGIEDAYTSYLRFGSQVVSEYNRLSEQFRFIVVDAERPIYEQHQFIRENYLNLCAASVPQGRFEAQLNPIFTEVDV